MYSWHQSRIKEIMGRSSFTLEDLLQESYDIVVSAANDETVYSFLKTPSQLNLLVDYALKEPVKRDDVPSESIPEFHKQLLYSTTACDTIAQSIQLLEAIIQDKAMLNQLFDALKQYKSAIVFHRVTTLIMGLFSINAMEMIEYIKGFQSDFLKNLIGQIGGAPTEDILIIVRLLLRPNPKVPGIGDWLVSEQLIKLLIDNLKPNPTCSHNFDTACRETVVVLQEVLNDVIAKSHIDNIDIDNFDDFDINFSSSEDDKPLKLSTPPTPPPASAQILLKQFEDPEVLDILFSSMANFPTTLVHGIPLIIHLINQGTTASIIVSRSVNYLEQFLMLLKPDPSNRLGFSRLALMKFLIILLKLDIPVITTALIQLNSFKIALDVLLTYQDNTVVQNLVLDYFNIGLLRNTTITDIIISSNLTHRITESWDHLLVKCKDKLEDQAHKEHALSWLKKLFRNLKKESPSHINAAVSLHIVRSTKEWSYFGHLFRLANIVVNSIPNIIDDEETNKKEECLKLITDPKWTQFVENILKVYNAISAQKLDPDYSSDSDSSGGEE